MNKQKQALLILIITVFSWVDLSAQQGFEHIVYLKNGTKIHGKIIKDELDTLKIETCGGNIFVFNSSEILKKEQEQIKQSNEDLNPDVSNKFKGFYSFSTLGMLIGKSESNDAQTYSLHTSAGFQFNHFFGIGLGLGIEKLQTEIIPTYLSVKSYLTTKENSPFLHFYIGYSVPLSKEKNTDQMYVNNTLKYNGGINVGLDIGIISFKTPNRAITITAGYRYQHVKETGEINYYHSSTETNIYDFNRLAIKLGFMFM